MTMRERILGAALAAVTSAGCGNVDPVATELVVNEIGATGNDFVEFMNTSAAPVDVSGYAATDSRKDGLPKLSRAIRFPAGTVVPAGGFLVVLFEGECPSAAAPYVCVRGTGGGGVSQTRGENVHMIDPENQVIMTGTYPRNGSPSGWTWGRSPNGAGPFATTRRTPGYANAQ
jgi:hypothetical protein